MLKKILSISGKPGLYRLVSQGKNMLIVENIATGRRLPAYATDKVVSLGDIAIYTDDSDIPLGEVLQTIGKTNEGKQVDVKALGDDANVRDYFATILPDFDRERVYTTDIRKLLSWYNQLVAAGITEFVEPEETEAPADDKAAAAEK